MAYTTHGHHIPGSATDDKPRSEARCGGPQLCPICKAQTGTFHRHPANASIQEKSMQAKKFVRRQFAVEAVRVTEDNMEQVATWCEGAVKETDDGVKYVKVKVIRPLNVKHSQAFVGDWVSISDAGYKVYTNRAFEKSFHPERSSSERNVFENTEELRVTNDPVPTDHDETPAPAQPVQTEPLVAPKPTPREALGFNAPKNIIKD